MANSIAARAERNAWRVLLATRGEEVTYRISETKSISIRVVITRPDPTKKTDDVAILESKLWDVLVDPATLLDPVTDAAFAPRRGHSVETAAGVRYQFTPGPSDLLCRWNSNFRTWLRVHAEEA